MSLLELLAAKKKDLAAKNRKKTAKLVDGTSRWRVLPSWRGGDQQFWHDFGQHYVKDAADELKAIYVCTDKTFGKPCAVCETIAQAIKGATDDATMKVLSEAKSNGRVLVNAMRIDGPTPTQVEILELPPTVFGQLIEIFQEWEEAGESVIDVDAGKEVLITRTGTGKNTKYTTQAAAKLKGAAPGKAVMALLNNLDEYVQQETTEGAQRALTSVRSIAGLLGGPSTAATGVGSGLPVAARGAAVLVEDDDENAVATPPSKRAGTPAVFAAADEDITDVPESVTAKPAPVAAKPAAAAPAAAVAAEPIESTGDGELDELLASLNTK